MSDATPSSTLPDPEGPAQAETDTTPPPAEKSAGPKKKYGRRNFTTLAAIAFSLTFVGGAVALLAGMLPSGLTTLHLGIDLGVVLLIVPLCALVLALLVEVLRMAIVGLPRLPVDRRGLLTNANAVPDWASAGRHRA